LNLERLPLLGHFVRLEPYEEAIKEEVRRALDCDAEAWNLFAMSGQGQHFEAWWTNIDREMRAGRWLAYAIRELSDGIVVGTSSFLNIKPERARGETQSGVAVVDTCSAWTFRRMRAGARRRPLVTDRVRP
jgi:hypothetical protein